MINDTKESTLNDQSIVSRIEGFQLRRSPCCTTLYDENNLPVLSLNGTSSLIWENCNGELKIIELIDQFHSVFPDIPYKDLKVDTMNVLNQFQQEKVIKLK
ncbi:MAG: PqqD family protein [Gammaproteobacteria bacterium]|nr:PqqD family protein [Gammaproteobacteria bacterium]